jgi:hypothetical protein
VPLYYKPVSNIFRVLRIKTGAGLEPL